MYIICTSSGCRNVAQFGYDRGKSLYCKYHKTSDMINTLYKNCANIECTKRPSFNLPGKKPAMYCRQHSLPGMIDIRNKKCIYNGCLSQPHYNISGEKRGLYCRKHKLPNMINIHHLLYYHRSRYDPNIFNALNSVLGTNPLILEAINIIQNKCNVTETESLKNKENIFSEKETSEKSVI
jgi:hypothetical protein